MENIIVPFRLKNIWLGLDIGKVKGVDSCGKISVMPNAQAPLVGLMQKNGKILPVWSLFSLVNESKDDVKNCPCYMEVFVKDKTVVIPVHEILSASSLAHGWVPLFKYGLKIYRSLDKKTPQQVHTVEEMAVSNAFHKDTPTSKFRLEDIS